MLQNPLSGVHDQVVDAMQSKKKVQNVKKEAPKISQTINCDSIDNCLHQIQRPNIDSYRLDHTQCTSMEHNNNRLLTCDATIRARMRQQYLINNHTYNPKV